MGRHMNPVVPQLCHKVVMWNLIKGLRKIEDYPVHLFLVFKVLVEFLCQTNQLHLTTLLRSKPMSQSVWMLLA